MRKSGSQIDPDESSTIAEAKNTVTEEEMRKNNEWVMKTLDESKRLRITAIVIDKLRYRLYLIDKGVVGIELPIELGFNPVEDKRIEGDGCTPEGFYKITEKRDIGKTKFYRGFMLNYPNELDKREFADLIASRDVPQEALIGGLIMIHGRGSGLDPSNGGANWTLGCVALSNEDIDRIFGLVGVGTPVTIVKTCSVFQ